MKIIFEPKSNNQLDTSLYDDEEDEIKIYQPNECYFAVDDTEDGVCVCITGIDYYNDNLCLDDQFGDHSLTDSINEKFEEFGMCNLTDAMWESESSVDKTSKFLSDLGFVKNEKFSKFCSRQPTNSF